jgi:uncharacterized protein YbjQ (UPF0145 family)
MRKTAVAPVALLIVIGCATTAIEDPMIRRATAAVELVETKPTREFDIISEVTGISCARQVGSSPSIEAAKQNMKVEAGKLGADAVVNIACEENNNVSWKHNCWKNTECKGDAVKWRSK